MEFGGEVGDAKQANGTNATSFDKKKIGTLLDGTDWSTATKLGEGDFTLRLTVEDNTANNGTKDVKVELVDKSNFNGGKEYVMDSQTIKEGAKNGGVGQGKQTVTLAGQEIKFTDLDKNFVNANKTTPANKIKTLDINIKNEVKKEKCKGRVII